MNTWDEWGLSWWNNITPILTGPYSYLLTTNADTKSNCQQNDSLDCGHDEKGFPILTVKDDAGKYCCPNQMSIIQLRIEKTSLFPFNTGHAFLVQIKNAKVVKAWGFHPSGNMEFEQGQLITEETERKHEYDFYIEYYACEESVKTIDENAEKTKNYYYETFNIGFHNCMGMASKWLEDAHFKAPYISSLPALPGYDLRAHIPLYLLSSFTYPYSMIFQPAYHFNVVHYAIFNYRYNDRIHNKDAQKDAR